MRFLANENVAGDAVVALREKGHDVAWIRTDAPGSKDEDVLARAMAEQRILITFDNTPSSYLSFCLMTAIYGRVRYFSPQSMP